MPLSRLFFNRLRKVVLEDLGSCVQLPLWAMRDYRSLSMDELLCLAKELKIDQTLQSIKASSSCYETFEQWYSALCEELEIEGVTHRDIGGEIRLELLQRLSSDSDDATPERLWLVMFEFWRRFFPEQQTFELLCDDIDDMIFRYNLHDWSESDDLFEGACDQSIQDVLLRISELINQQSRSKKQARELFSTIETSCAHDVEGFLYNYIYDQIEAGAIDCAGELIQTFLSYVDETRWFELLEVLALEGRELSEGFTQLLEMIEKKSTEHDLDVALEALAHMSEYGLDELYARYLSWCLAQRLEPSQLQALADLVSNYLEHSPQPHYVEKVIQTSPELFKSTLHPSSNS